MKCINARPDPIICICICDPIICPLFAYLPDPIICHYLYLHYLHYL